MDHRIDHRLRWRLFSESIDMRLLHYTNAPFHLDHERQYGRSSSFKPTGLWVSVEGDDDWRSWCEDNNFCTENLKCSAEILIAHTANILLIDTVAKIDEFTARFSPNSEQLAYNPALNLQLRWDDVKAAYDGVIIATYFWERRTDLMWYYGWDCASGVIWNLSAIEIARNMPSQIEVQEKVYTKG
jgi:hypothetical protein